MAHAISETTVYHHTSIKGAEGILASGYIKASIAANGDAVFGDGAYVSRKGQETPIDEIAENIFDGPKSFWESQRYKTAVVFEIKLPRTDVIDANVPGRDVSRIAGDISCSRIVRTHYR